MSSDNPNPRSTVGTDLDDPELRASVGSFTVAFIDRRDTGPTLLGSGTLASIGGCVGIITAAHVVEDAIANRQGEKLGVLCSSMNSKDSQGWIVPKYEYVAFRNKGWTESGPDLAFVKLPSELALDLEAIGSILNIDKQIADAFLQRNYVAVREVVAGYVGEWTAVGSPASVFTGMIHPGALLPLDKEGGYDRVQFKLGNLINAVPPKSYGGVSGGGFWRIFYGDDGKIVRHALRGVAYYQSKDLKYLIGHGPMSVLDILFKEVSKNWPIG